MSECFNFFDGNGWQWRAWLVLLESRYDIITGMVDKVVTGSCTTENGKKMVGEW